jgi:hypothetical protein
MLPSSTEKTQKNSHAIPQVLKELNLIGLVEKYCVAIAKILPAGFIGTSPGMVVKRQDFKV